MKKQFLLLTLLVLSIGNAKAQLYSDIQTIVPADLNSDMRIYYSTKDNAGNTILTGQFAGTIIFSGSSITLTNPDWQTEDGDNYLTFIAKLNIDGTWAWARKIISTWGTNPVQWFEIRGTRTDALDNIFIVGDFAGTADLDGITITSSVPPNGGFGAADIFVAKMNTNGVFQWAKTEGTNKGPELARDLAVDASGNVIVIGSYTNKLPSCSSCYTSDVFIAKFNSSGVKQWAKNIGNATMPLVSGIYTNAGFTIDTDSPGNIYIGGKFIGTLKFGSITVKSKSVKILDAFAAKLNSSGNAIWVRTGNTTSNTSLQRGSIDNSGNTYFGGRGATGNLVFNGTTYSNVGKDFLIKLNNAGSVAWIKNVGSANWSPDDYAPKSVLVNSAGNIDILPNTNDDAPFLAEYNSNGNLQFTESLENVYAGDLCKNAIGVTVAMNFENTITLPTGSGPLTISIPYAAQYQNMGVFIADFSSSIPPPAPSPNWNDTPVEETFEFGIFPNPANDKIFIRLEDDGSVSEIVICDQLGKIIWSQPGKGGETMFSIDLTGSRFSNGNYSISAISKGERITQRFVIAK